MAPSTSNQHRRTNENSNPQHHHQQQYSTTKNAYSSSITRKHNPTSTVVMPKKKSTGIERSYESISNKILPSTTSRNGGSSGRSSAGSNNSSSSSQSTYSSFTRNGVSGGSRASGRTSSSGGGGGGGMKKETGIERSYDSVTQTLKSMGLKSTNKGGRSGSGGGSSSGVANDAEQSLDSRSSGKSSRASSSSAGGGGESLGGQGRMMMMGPPAPVASKSMDDSSTIHYNSTFEEVGGEEEEEVVVMDTPTLTVKGTSVVVNQNNGGGGNNGGMKYQGEPSGSSSQAIGSHLRLIATSSMSYDDYERLRDESRMLKLEHAQKYGGGADGGGRQAGKKVVGGMMIKEGKKSEGPVHLVASKSGEESSSILLDQAMNNRASNRASSSTPSQGKEFTHSTSTTLITNKHRSSLDRGVVNTKKIGKGVVKMTTESLSKIRDVLHLTSSNDMDEMSFFCSDVNTGIVTKQKVSLDNEENKSGAATNNSSRGGSRMISANDKAARGQRLASELRNSNPPQSVVKVAKSARTSMDRTATQIKNGIGPAFEAVTKTALAVTKEGVGVMAHDVAPKIGTGIAYTARNVVKVTQQSVEGVGMMVSDIATNVNAQANAKTPAKSNVTKHDGDYHMNQMFDNQKEGKYADYVHDPNYKVVLTPPPQGEGNANNNVMNAGKTPYHKFVDPQTPACLLGAVAAGRCNLPGTHPDSLEFLPDGIPRELVVHDDWEERAGFLPTVVEKEQTASNSSVADIKYIVDSSKFADEAKPNVAREDRRISFPIDVDEETATINGEEVDVEEMLALKEGRPSPKNSALDGIANGNRLGFDHEPAHEDSEETEVEEDGSDEEEQYGNDDNDPRNASMWVAVPDNYMEDDDNASADNYLEKSMYVAAGDYYNKEEDEEESVNVDDVNIGEMLHEEDEKEQPLITPSSCGSDTFFVGDVQIGFDSSPENNKIEKICEVTAYEEQVVGSATEVYEDDNTAVAPSDDEASKVLEEDAKSEDAKSWTTNNLKSPTAINQVASSSVDLEEEDSLTSLAKATTAAVVHDKELQQQKRAKEFETPHSVKKGERALSFTEFKDMNKHVLFNLNQEDVTANHDGAMQNNTLGENYAHQQLYLNPSESTELSHEPPVRMVDSSAHQQLYSNPSESTDLSQFSNWAVPATTAAKKEGGANSDPKSLGKRQLKGRIILVRIKKKICKVGKKMLFIKSSKKKGKETQITDGNSFVIALPTNTNQAFPISPSASVLSATSSILTGNGSNAVKRTLGAVPPKNGSPTPAQQFLYGTINYGMRSPEESTVDGTDSLPPPPGILPPRPRTSGSEDAVSYLAEAMRRAKSTEGDDEDSVLLLVTPKDDGTGEEEISQIVTATDGTPHVREIIEAVSEDEIANSEVKPNNLACLFTDEKGNNVQYSNGTPIQIMDAVEVDEGIVLTPHKVSHNVEDVFRTSIDTCSILPGSHIDSDDEEEDTLYHDGNTVIRHSSTFGDNTIATMTSAAHNNPSTKGLEEVAEHEVESKVVKSEDKTPTLTPDGLPLTRQAAANASFLFSPENMGRAKPSIRAKERASLKDGKVKPSITMLPSATTKSKSTHVDETVNESALVIRQSYSYSRSSLGTNNNDDPLPTTSEDSVSSTEEEAEVDVVQKLIEPKPPMSSMTDDRQFSFKTILNKFSTDANDHHALPSTAVAPATLAEVPAANEEEMTPVVTNSDPKKYPKTPLPDETVLKTVDTEDSSPLLVTLKTASNSPLSTSSVSSFKSAKGSASRKKHSPKYKNLPKSALRVRKGFVKDRVSDFHQNMSTNGAVTDVNGRLKRNHSYRFKNTRRMTNGNGVLAPRQATLQSTYIRSVPIAIAKSYSRDSVGNSFSYEEHEEEVLEEQSTTYAAKYTANPAEAKLKSVNAMKQADSFDNNSPASSRSVSDTSETSAECDPFSSLLGKVESDEDSSDDDDEDVYESNLGKENAVNSSASSPSVHLGFKSTTRALVKPTMINQHDESDQLAPVPMKAQSWRVLAAKAQFEKQQR